MKKFLTTRKDCEIVLEQLLAKEGNQKYVNDVVCKVLKAGSKLPTSQDIVKLWSDFLPKFRPTGLDENQVMLLDGIERALCHLAQLALAAERM